MDDFAVARVTPATALRRMKSRRLIFLFMGFLEGSKSLEFKLLACNTTFASAWTLAVSRQTRCPISCRNPKWDIAARFLWLGRDQLVAGIRRHLTTANPANVSRIRGVRGCDVRNSGLPRNDARTSSVA